MKKQNNMIRDNMVREKNEEMIESSFGETMLKEEYDLAEAAIDALTSCKRGSCLNPIPTNYDVNNVRMAFEKISEKHRSDEFYNHFADRITEISYG